MKNRFLLIPLALILIASLVACAAPAPAPGTAPTVTVTAPAPADKPMEAQKWAYFLFNPNVEANEDKEIQLAFDRIKERTNGLLDIVATPATALPIKSEERLRAESAGEIEMMINSTDYDAGDFPLYRFFEVPYLWRSQAEKLQVHYATLPLIEREMNKLDVHMLSFRVQPKKGLFLNNPVDSILDLKKVKIRGPGVSTGMILEALNGTPVTIAWGETYTALEKGIVEGVCTGTDSIILMKMHEISPYFYNIDWVGTMLQISVNKSKWDALPRDVQDIVNEELNQALAINQTRVASTWASLKAKALATGLEEWNDETPPSEFFDRMSELVTKPMLADALERVDPALANEMLIILEQALGRKIN